MSDRVVFFIMMIILHLFLGCQLASKSPNNKVTSLDKNINSKHDTAKAVTIQDNNQKRIGKVHIPDGFMEITEDTAGISLDLKYATSDNFTGKIIYDCGRCFLESKAAKKILAINRDLKLRYGFGLKIFDCYRPSPFQQRLWDIVPNPDYVAPPNKGSVHGRGQAIDLTITDQNGKELDMGTPFDFFGEEAHSDYTDLKDEVLKNRRLLSKMMELHGFRGIRTEWWHFSVAEVTQPLHDWTWDCN